MEPDNLPPLDTVDDDDLEYVKLSSLPAEEQECPICREPMDAESSGEAGEDHVPVRLHHNHVYGSHCIREWFDTSTTCPTCRKVMCEDDDVNPIRMLEAGTLVVDVETFLRLHEDAVWDGEKALTADSLHRDLIVCLLDCHEKARVSWRWRDRRHCHDCRKLLEAFIPARLKWYDAGWTTMDPAEYDEYEAVCPDRASGKNANLWASQCTLTPAEMRSNVFHAWMTWYEESLRAPRPTFAAHPYSYELLNTIGRHTHALETRPTTMTMVDVRQWLLSAVKAKLRERPDAARFPGARQYMNDLVTCTLTSVSRSWGRAV